MAVIRGKKIKEENTSTFFSFRAGNTFMHKLPPALKIILMTLLALAAFWVPTVPAFITWGSLIVFSFFVLSFKAKEILIDIKPSLIYALLFYSASILLNVIEQKTQVFIPDSQYLATLSHLALSLEITSLFYRTTTTSQFTQGFRNIEQSVTKKNKTPFADSLSFTLVLVPRIASFWKRICSAWSSRGGKANVSRIKTLVPVLFRVSMEEAYHKTLAQQNRS